MFSLGYLADSTVGPIEWVIAALVAIAILLLVVYALTRFIAWAARR